MTRFPPFPPMTPITSETASKEMQQWMANVARWMNEVNRILDDHEQRIETLEP